MSENVTSGEASSLTPPVSSFTGPVGELVAHELLSPPPRPGVLASLDRFEILRLLGGGGMGVVLLARDTTSGQEVAIKLIKPDLVADQQVVHRFVKEAGHMHKLRHRNVMPVLEVSDRSRGPYFVMPYFERGSLARRIQPGQPLEAETILDTASQIAEGLQYAHRRGIIHRDLKPANILLAADGKACLADFGLARTLFNDSIVDVERQQFEGTAPYMSPGVAAGNAEDTRCDIYSFGALLYEMLTGDPPYKGATVKEIRGQILAGPPKPIRELNPKADANLVAIAEGAMARELRDRYADMIDVLTDLQRTRAGAPPVGPRGLAERPRPAVQRPARTPWFYWIPAGLLAAAAVVSFLWPAVRPAVIPKPPRQFADTNAIPVPQPPQPSEFPKSVTVTTLAGQAGVNGNANGVGGAARFSAPFGVAADMAGNVFVADAGNDMIRKIATNGVVTTVAGEPGARGSTDAPGAKARFNGPFSVAVDTFENLYVADTGNNTIRKIKADGTVATLAGTPGVPGNADGFGPAARFRNPWGLAVDGGGNVYVADMSNSEIRRVAANGAVSTLAGAAGSPGSADGPGLLARFNCPFGVEVDNAGNVYVADTYNHTIRRIDPAGQVSTLAGLAGHPGSADGTGSAARFCNPKGLAVDGAGNVFVADTDNFLIRRITPDGVVTTVAGQSGTSGGSADGNGLTARFLYPGGVALDEVGNLFIVDTDNHTVRKASFQGVMPLAGVK